MTRPIVCLTYEVEVYCVKTLRFHSVCSLREHLREPFDMDKTLGKTTQDSLSFLLSKNLGEHFAVYSAVYCANTDSAKRGVQDIPLVARAVY